MIEIKVDNIVTLNDGKKHLILSDTLYDEKHYFLAGEVNDNEDDLTGAFGIYEEKHDENNTYVSVIRDQELLKVLTKLLEPKE